MVIDVKHMVRYMLRLEWLSFRRAPAFGAKLAIKILMVFLALYFITIFTGLGIGLYYLLEDEGLPPLPTVNAYLIYYLLADLILRYFFQQMPVTHIKPLLSQPVSKRFIVHFSLVKSMLSVFNWIHAFLFIPFTVVLHINGFTALQVLSWHAMVMGCLWLNHFANILSNYLQRVFYPLLVLVVAALVCEFNGVFSLSLWMQPFFDYSFTHYFPVLLLWGGVVALYLISFRYFTTQMRLDVGLAKKADQVKATQLHWLDRWGLMGTFMKNDIRLILRNKRARATLISSGMILFYGLLFMQDTYKEMPFMMVFAGIFTSGGFLFSFGQFVPSWDSAYYPLMMSQNIQYRDYLNAKWWLIVSATALSAVLALFYLYFGWLTYLYILCGAVYNIGINAYLVLLGGAFVKTPIDLSSASQAFGQRQGFNLKLMLISLPKLVLPMLVYFIGTLLVSPLVGILAVCVVGLLGLIFKNAVFRYIEQLYKTEKHLTLAAFKKGE